MAMVYQRTVPIALLKVHDGHIVHADCDDEPICHVYAIEDVKVDIVDPEPLQRAEEQE